MSKDIDQNINTLSESSGYEYEDFNKGSKDLIKQQDDLELIIKTLSDNRIYNTDECEDLIFKIDGYINTHKRFLYSAIYSFVVDMNPEKNLSLYSNISKVYEYSLEKYKNNSKNVNIFKLYDYVNLAILQKDRLNDVNEVVYKVQKESMAMKSSLEKLNQEYRDRVKEFENSKSKFYDQLIAAMAIFISVAFIIFGGISSLSGLSVPLSKVIETGKNSIILYKVVIIWALGMINLLSLFMIFISKILDKRLVIKKLYYRANIVLIALFLMLIVYQVILKIISAIFLK